MAVSNGKVLANLSNHLWEAANILRGPVDAADFKTYIFPLLFFKRISDVWDEEYAAAMEESGGDLQYADFAEQHRFQIPEREVQKALRKTLLKYKLHRDQALFDRAYEYIRQYY